MRSTIALAAAALVLAACGSADEAPADTSGAPPADTAAGATQATAVLRDSAGRELGTVTLADAAGGIAVSGTLRGVAPGTYGFHLHTVGQCEPTFEAAGGHWNPTSAQHGSENPQGPHLGDMPNVTVGADSTVAIQTTTPGGSLRGENALLDADGAAVMLHAGTDDYRTDPTGGAGARMACGAVQG